MARVRLGLGRLGPDKVVNLANGIKTAMTGNANFEMPNPPLVDLGTAIDAAVAKIAEYNVAVTEAETALERRKQAVAELAALLTQEAAYVENASNGDVTKIASAGMQVWAPNRRLGRLGRVLELEVLEGVKEGTLKARWKRLRGARVYEIQVTADVSNEASWVFSMAATKSKAVITGLTSGAKMWVRVRAVGAGNEPGPWSDPAVKTVP
jgi:hypothetical protein